MSAFKKKRIVVGYAVSNLHGKFEDRSKYLPAMLLEGILDPDRDSMGMWITNHYMDGPGIKNARIFKTAERNGLLQWLGNVSLRVSSINNEDISTDVIQYLVNTNPGYTIDVKGVSYQRMDEYDWGLYHLRNSPNWDLLKYDFTVNYDDATSVITYSFVDPVTEAELHPDVFISVPPLDFESNYIFAPYDKMKLEPPETKVLENKTNPPAVLPVPPIPNIPSNFGPPTVTTSETALRITYNSVAETPYINFEIGDTVLGEVMSKKGRYKEIWNSTETKKKNDDGSVGELESWSVNRTAEFTYTFSTEFLQFLVYKENSGNFALDTIIANAVTQVSSSYEKFYPVLPLRLDHQEFQNLSPDYWRLAKRAGRKGNLRIDKIHKGLLKESDQAEFSYIFIRFGVGINGHRRDRKDLAKYLWHFFQQFSYSSSSGMLDKVNQYNAEMAAYKQALQEYLDNPSTWSGTIPSPPKPIAIGKQTKFEYKCTPPHFGYHVEYYFNGISYNQGPGVRIPGMRPRQYRVVRGDTKNIPPTAPPNIPPGDWGNVVNNIGKDIYDTSDASFFIVHQIDENTWEQLQIFNLKERIIVFKGKYKEVPSWDIWDNIDEPQGRIGAQRDSELIIPLLPSIVKQCGMVSKSQLGTESSWVAIHVYKKVKVKRGWVKYIGIIIAAVISFFCYACSGWAFGVAAAGTAATTAIVNFLISMLVAALILVVVVKIAVALFGEKWGNIIGAIAAVIISMYTGGMTFSFSNPSTYMAIGNAVVGGYGQYYEFKNKELDKQIQEYSKSSKDKWDEIYGQMTENIDPMSNSDIQRILRAVVDRESPDQFLNRTLSVGSDIVESTLGQVSNFTETNLRLPM